MAANEARVWVGVSASVIIALQGSQLGDTIGEERGLRASLRSRPGVSARDPRGGVCENNRREADSRFNAWSEDETKYMRNAQISKSLHASCCAYTYNTLMPRPTV